MNENKVTNIKTVEYPILGQHTCSRNVQAVNILRFIGQKNSTEITQLCHNTTKTATDNAKPKTHMCFKSSPTLCDPMD